MENLLTFLRSDNFLIGLLVFNILLFILFLFNNRKLRKLRKAYLEFMNKLGHGNSIEEMLKDYVNSVKDIEKREDEIEKYLVRLDNTVDKCFQKIGVYRYNAFKDTGSDLSFTLAILDKENSGIMLNGIYSFEASNIYAKPIEKGKSTYTLSKEEEIALDRAIHCKE